MKLNENNLSEKIIPVIRTKSPKISELPVYTEKYLTFLNCAIYILSRTTKVIRIKGFKIRRIV